MSSNNSSYVMELLELLKKGRIYDLEHLRFQGMPIFPLARPGYFYGLHRHHRDSYKEKGGRRTGSSGVIFMSDQSGTHIDALCHQAWELKLFDGTPVDSQVETPWGFTKHGAESIAPIIRRGLLLDVAKMKGQDPLPEGYGITEEDLEGCCSREGVEVKEGDVVLVRMGNGRFWNDEERYYKSAGVTLAANLWLAERRVFAVGSDNLTWDLHGKGDSDSGDISAGHRELLAKRGIHIIENLYLEELSKDRCYEFLFLAFPLKFKGATGSPLRPIAVALPSTA